MIPPKKDKKGTTKGGKDSKDAKEVKKDEK